MRDLIARPRVCPLREVSTLAASRVAFRELREAVPQTQECVRHVVHAEKR
jgi:hypothetical protein